MRFVNFEVLSTCYCCCYFDECRHGDIICASRSWKDNSRQCEEAITQWAYRSNFQGLQQCRWADRIPGSLSFSFLMKEVSVIVLKTYYFSHIKNKKQAQEQKCIWPILTDEVTDHQGDFTKTKPHQCLKPRPSCQSQAGVHLTALPPPAEV